MSVAMRYTTPEVQNRLAQSYVLGTLSLAARRRCDELRKQIPELDQRIRRLEEHLQPLADAVPSLPPSPRVWEQINTSITPESRTTRTPLWERVPFLRGLAVMSSLVAVALLLIQLSTGPTLSTDYVAVLADEVGQARFVVTASEKTKHMDIRVFGDALVVDDIDYQLWAVSKTDGEIRSLGLVNVNDASQRTLNETDWRLVGDAHELLVTAEMPGGSAIGEPSESIISRGLCVRLSES